MDSRLKKIKKLMVVYKINDSQLANLSGYKKGYLSMLFHQKRNASDRCIQALEKAIDSVTNKGSIKIQEDSETYQVQPETKKWFKDLEIRWNSASDMEKTRLRGEIMSLWPNLYPKIIKSLDKKKLNSK